MWPQCVLGQPPKTHNIWLGNQQELTTIAQESQHKFSMCAMENSQQIAIVS